MNKTKIWKVQNEVLQEVTSGGLNLEERIHTWIENDLSIVIPNALLIGSKVKTDHGKELDLLAIDENGDLIVLELKRGLTTREVTAQALDYVSWVASLSIEQIDEILNKNGGNRSIGDLVSKKYSNDEIEINQNQKIYIVASEIDIVTERICRYLASNGVPINVATFNYYKDGENEIIARNVLVTDIDSPGDSVKKKSGRFVTNLFNDGKIEVGQSVKYLPLTSKGVDVIAEVFRSGSKCLKMSDTGEEYSFSGLRRKLIIEHGLELNAYYGYGQWGEWELVEKKVKLSEL